MAGDLNVIGHFSEQESSALTGPFQNLNLWMMGSFSFFGMVFVFVLSVVCMRYHKIFKDAFLANVGPGFYLKVQVYLFFRISHKNVSIFAQ